MQIWYGVDPMASLNPSQTSFSYAANSPLMFVDPNGGEHIMYLVFEKGNKNANKIAKEAQAIIDKNGINLQVKIMFVGKNGFKQNFRSKLDATDAMSFVGSKKFVDNLSKKDVGQGLHSDRVGYVNEEGVREDYSHAQNSVAPVEKYIARVAIHEGGWS